MDSQMFSLKSLPPPTLPLSQALHIPVYLKLHNIQPSVTISQALEILHKEQMFSLDFHSIAESCNYLIIAINHDYTLIVQLI